MMTSLIALMRHRRLLQSIDGIAGLLTLGYGVYADSAIWVAGGFVVVALAVWQPIPRLMERARAQATTKTDAISQNRVTTATSRHGQVTTETGPDVAVSTSSTSHERMLAEGVAARNLKARFKRWQRRRVVYLPLDRPADVFDGAVSRTSGQAFRFNFAQHFRWASPLNRKPERLTVTFKSVDEETATDARER